MKPQERARRFNEKYVRYYKITEHSHNGPVSRCEPTFKLPFLSLYLSLSTFVLLHSEVNWPLPLPLECLFGSQRQSTQHNKYFFD